MQQSSMPSRKRPAPGASPANPQSQATYTVQPGAPNQPLQNDSSFADWAASTDYRQFPDNLDAIPGNLNSYDATTLGYNPALDAEDSVHYMNGTDPQNAGQLVRRNANQQLARQARNSWDGDANPDRTNWEEEEDDDDELERRASEAKKEAITKKRQIPPFVQKIRSFLDEDRNTELIRWSDDGKSFVVLDEDEFAKTLIPELFKHKNYASFVRQLNMYGFHKKVGLSDNSMKASESRRKTPSEYANPYFRQGRPELLWLIQKPKSAPGKKGPDGKIEEEEEIGKKPGSIMQPVKGGKSQDTSKDLVAINRNDLDSIKTEIYNLKKRNEVISNYIGSLRQQNSTIHQQAEKFQAAQNRFQQMYDRHESSINAILTFLATFYNRSLEGQNQPNFAEMFASTLPPSGQSGSIVDMSDMPNMDLQNMASRSMNQPRRNQKLLLAAPHIASSSTTPLPTPKVESIDTPVNASSHASPSPAAGVNDMLSRINWANANSPQASGANNFDFDSALEHLQTSDGNMPLTDAETTDILTRMTQDAGSTLDTTPAKPSNPQQNTNSALGGVNQSFNIPNMPTTADFDRIRHQQYALDQVQKLQDDQNQRVREIADKLGPLSPNGFIPGIHDNSNVPVPDSFDLDDWLNNPYFPENSGNLDGNADNGLNIPHTSLTGLEGLENSNTLLQQNLGGDGTQAHSVSSQAASPATVETLDDVDADTNVLAGEGSRKRRRRD
ncbi:hypothetical protein BT63DRAFT_262711 [Microthyrium microscopicum]|uniref:HSF-type DNA-binding domain-containing protein n=1 Tax=Microthyrium microscopicum TaxID=703497 RepID=A0A6A6UD43_9PEZI|nr:hypothetical protein BT63DRAFT_262711 [Microthyrium microscopicum]